MAFNIDLGASTAQFKNFVDFATNSIAKGDKGLDTVAGLSGLGGGDFGSHKIGVCNSDSTFKLFRSQNSKDLNNVIRDIFKKSISDIFGGEKNIPKNVLDTMKLGDFGKGKPLTARRILAVNEAISKSLDNDHTPEIKNNYENTKYQSTTQYYESILQGAYSNKITVKPEEAQKLAKHIIDSAVNSTGEYMDAKDKEEASNLLANASFEYHISDTNILEKIAQTMIKECRTYISRDREFNFYGDETFVDKIAKEYSSGIPKEYAKAYAKAGQAMHDVQFGHFGCRIFARNLLAETILKHDLRNNGTIHQLAKSLGKISEQDYSDKGMLNFIEKKFN